jgi:hypothetical protein
MSKPVVEIQITTLDEKSAAVKAVFDTGSFYSILRADKVPPGANVIQRSEPRVFRTAARDGSLHATGELPVVMTIGDREVDDVVMVAPELSQELIVGAGTMQKWDISVVTKEGRTAVHVGRHMHDPDVTEVD